MKVMLPKPLAELGRDPSPLASHIGDDSGLCWLSCVALVFGNKDFLVHAQVRPGHNGGFLMDMRSALM